MKHGPLNGITGRSDVSRSAACCFTGHRDISEDNEAVKHRLAKLIDLMIDRGIRCFIFGGARGFDTLAANVVSEFLIHGEAISLKFILPSENSRFYTSTLAKELRYRYPDSIFIEKLSDSYVTGITFSRNKRMVDESSFCIAYLDPNVSGGGTRYTVNYAREMNVPTYNIFFSLSQNIDLPL